MAEDLTLRVITPDHIVLDTPASSVKVPGVDGLMGILPRHAQMITALDVGLLTYTHDGKEHTIFVSGGFAEVRQNTVRVVSEAGEEPDEIDADRAGKSEVDLLRAEAALRRALMRQKARKRRGI